MSQIQEIVTKLDALAAMQKQQVETARAFEKKRQALLTPIQNELNALEAQFTVLKTTQESLIAATEAEVKADVIALGESVKGTTLHAIYAKGRSSWDSGKLEGFAAAHPEILQFRKIGEPSVSLRVLKS